MAAVQGTFFVSVNKSMRWITLPLFLISTLLFTFGCQKSNDSGSETATLKAYRLIDENRMDESIQLLQDEIQAKENRKEIDDEYYSYISIMASAYAKKAGITMRTLVQSYNQIKTSLARTDELIPKKKSADKNQRVIQDIEEQIRNYTKLSRILKIMPVIDDNSLVYLNYAIALLDKIPKPATADHMYRIILRVVAFTHLISNANINKVLPETSKTEEQCVVHLRKTNEYLLLVSKLYIKILDDLSLAFPSQV
jgi:hypothetical protein